MALAQTRDVIWPEVEVLAVSGDAAQGEALTRDSSRRFPEDTLINSVYLPFLRAGLELHHGDAVHAVDALQAAVPYERAFWQVLSLRGLAYLKAGKGSEAAAQFQRMMEYKGGLRVNHPWQALAHLYLGRAWAMAGDKQKSRIAYQKFLTLWKDADPNIPILLEARAEYAKLR
jgi:tetratricopeptide (TPR) repeat protein